MRWLFRQSVQCHNLSLPLNTGSAACGMEDVLQAFFSILQSIAVRNNANCHISVAETSGIVVLNLYNEQNFHNELRNRKFPCEKHRNAEIPLIAPPTQLICRENIWTKGKLMEQAPVRGPEKQNPVESWLTATLTALLLGVIVIRNVFCTVLYRWPPVSFSASLIDH